MALKTQLNRIATAKKKYETELSKINRKAIAASLGEVIPEGFALTRTQYTPGFNDGDPCTFTLGEVTLCAIKKVEEVATVETPRRAGARGGRRARPDHRRGRRG